MQDGVMTEADTCREFVTPRLVAARDLIAAIRCHEAEVMRRLGEIEALVSEVQS